MGPLLAQNRQESAHVGSRIVMNRENQVRGYDELDSRDHQQQHSPEWSPSREDAANNERTIFGYG